MALINTGAQIRFTCGNSPKFKQGTPYNLKGVTKDISGYVRKTNRYTSP